MKQRPRIYYSDTQKALMWDRWKEGENDDLEGWRYDHRLFFARNGGFDREMMLVCERFKLVHDYG